MRAHYPYSSIIIGRDGKVVEWMEKVTDADYHAAADTLT